MSQWSVCTDVGGIQLDNTAFLLHASVSPQTRRSLSGVAVISAIVSSVTPKEKAQGLRRIVDSFHRAKAAKEDPLAVFSSGSAGGSVQELLDAVGDLMLVTRKQTPLVHQVSTCWF